MEILDDEQEFSQSQYKSNCEAALELLEGGALQPDDIRRIVSAEPERYDFDCVIVDEAQDWPQEEANLLKALYDPNKICLADGIDQLIVKVFGQFLYFFLGLFKFRLKDFSRSAGDRFFTPWVAF